MTVVATLDQGRRGWGGAQRWTGAVLDCGVAGISQLVCEAARTGDH